MKAIRILANFASSIVWMVGCFTIISHARDHWPLALNIAMAAFLVGFGTWYLWRFFVQPFRAGLRGEQP